VEKNITIGGIVALAAVVGLMGYYLVSNPMNAQRTVLATNLANVQTEEVAFEKPSYDFDRWQQSIAAKPALWQELVAPPPAPPPPPEKPPDLDAMLKGVTAGRQQIGGKVKIAKAGDPKGSFLGVGDTVSGLTIKEISKTTVVLALTWKGQELTTSIPRK
jgi:hypothetical protein